MNLLRGEMDQRRPLRVEQQRVRAYLGRREEGMRPFERFGGAKLLGQKRTVTDELAANAVPLALIGIGVAWLAVRALQPHEEDPVAGGHYDVYEGYEEDEGFRAKLASRMAQARTRLTDVFGQAREGLAGVADTVREGRAGEMAEAARQRVDKTIREEPMTFGVVALIAGVVLGALLKSFAPDADEEPAKSSLNGAGDAATH